MKRTRVIDEVLIGPDLDETGTEKWNQYLVTDVTYHLGGHNAFTQQNEPRGYCVGVYPESRTERFKKFGLFSGVRVLILPANRFSQAKLDDLRPDADLVKKLQRQILTQIRAELDRRLTRAGGRGVDLAERIDHLDHLLSQRS